MLLVSFDSVTDLSVMLKKNGGRLEEGTETVFGALTSWAAEVGELEFTAGEASAARVDEVLKGVSEVGYDVVIMDVDALATSAQALNLAATDGVQTVVVGELRQTKRDELVDAMQMLERVKARMVGSIIFS